VLSLCELRRAARVLESELSGHRIDRAVQPDGESIALVLHGRSRVSGRSERRLLGLSCRRELARVGELSALPRAPERPPAFVSWLRAHLAGARLVGAEILDDDRQLALRFEAREGSFLLLLSLLGNRSNVYVLDASRQLVAALRPLAETRAELALGVAWQSPSGGPPSEGEDRWADRSDAEWLGAVEEEYAARESERGADDLSRALRQVLSRELKSARRRVERIEAELAEADEAAELQRHGELLKSALSRIQTGDREVRVTDFETGAELSIPLDPALSPKQNLEATFKRYQKLLRRLAKAGGQIDEAKRSCAGLEALAEQLESLTSGSGESDSEALQAFAARPELARLLARRPSAEAPAPAAATEGRPALPARLRGLPRKLLPRRYVSRDGLEIWVGRSDEGNDYLTTRLARGNDLFFHLDGAPGSHVILRTEGRSDPPSESLLDACELAVHFSKQKNAGRADVHIVPVKGVSKPRGAKPGLVWVTGGRSLHLRREEKRLQRLLASRIED